MPGTYWYRDGSRMALWLGKWATRALHSNGTNARAVDDAFRVVFTHLGKLGLMICVFGIAFVLGSASHMRLTCRFGHGILASS